MSDEVEDAAIAFLLRLDPATQRELLRRYEEVVQAELDTDSARLRRIAEDVWRLSGGSGRGWTR